MHRPTSIIAMLFICMCFFDMAFSQNIVERPQNQTVQEGETVLFRCIIRNLQMDQKIFWFRVSTRRFITVNRKVHSDVPQHNRLSILGNANLGEYFLQIRDVVLSDAGSYRCGYAVPGMPFTFAGAVLVIQRPPNPGSPSCEVSPSDLDVGDVATLTCRSEGGQPPASLTWRLGETILTEPKETRNVLAVIVSGDHNGREFVCNATSPAINVLHSCSVTLLMIPPSVRVEPPLGMAEVGGRITFTCVAFGLPQIVTYKWQFENEPVEDIQRIEVSQDGRNLIINDITMEDDESPVQCTATTMHGLLSTSEALLCVRVPGAFTVEKTTVNATGFFNDTVDGEFGKSSSVIIAVIVVAVMVGQILIVIVVYVIHRYVNRMMKERKAQRQLAPVMRDMNAGNLPATMATDTNMEETIHVGGVSINDRSDIDPERGAPEVCYDPINDASFDSSFSMGEGVHSQGLTTPPKGVSLTAIGAPLTSPPGRPEREKPPVISPPSPISSNATDLDQGNQASEGRLPPQTALPTSLATISESPYGYYEMPFVEAEEVARRPLPPARAPPRLPVVITSPPPNRPLPRVPADKLQSQPQARVPANHQYCPLNPIPPESRYLSLCHYDEPYVEEILQEGSQLEGDEEIYHSYDHPVTDPDADHRDNDHNDDKDEHHADDGYVYELPPSNSSPDEVYDIPPDADKREYTL